VLHQAAYRELGLDWEYEKLEVGESELPAFLASCDSSWAGLSLTMPLKVEALALASSATEVAELTGAANTLIPIVDSSSSMRWHADNTDVQGIVAAVSEVAPVEDLHTALILGAGATARSAIAAAKHLGVRTVHVAARRESAAADVAELGASLGLVTHIHDLRPNWHDADLVISTVPPDVGAEWAAQFPAHPRSVLLDVTYAPWPTPLAASWMGPVVRGHSMLLWQAVEQVRLMTGMEPPVDAMRSALDAALR
jgi:shikimate dehydrogenase